MEWKEGQTLLYISSTPSTISTEAELSLVRKRIGENGRLHIISHNDLINQHNDKYDGAISVGLPENHSMTFLSQVINLLKPSSPFILREESLPPQQPIDGKIQDISEKLLLSGFTETSVTQSTPQVSVIEVFSRKPNWEIGASNSLLRKPKTSNNTQVSNKKRWIVSDDLDEELIDEEALLGEEDLKLPVKCSTDTLVSSGKKKACKNCTCGRAQLQDDDIVEPKPQLETTDLANFKSSCGNCSLGDAFRCSGCPFLGQPAFKKAANNAVTLDLSDDF